MLCSLIVWIVNSPPLAYSPIEWILCLSKSRSRTNGWVGARPGIDLARLSQLIHITSIRMPRVIRHAQKLVTLPSGSLHHLIPWGASFASSLCDLRRWVTYLDIHLEHVGKLYRYACVDVRYLQYLCCNATILKPTSYTLLQSSSCNFAYKSSSVSLTKRIRGKNRPFFIRCLSNRDKGVW